MFPKSIRQLSFACKNSDLGQTLVTIEYFKIHVSMQTDSRRENRLTGDSSYRL
jgi:hypothetical protein